MCPKIPMLISFLHCLIDATVGLSFESIWLRWMGKRHSCSYTYVFGKNHSGHQHVI